MPQLPGPVISKLQEATDELSSAIDAQTAILQDLITRRADARKRLNLLLDPMARLPLEIQSHIFLEVCVDQPDNAPNSPPILFLSVCRLWREIALSTPKLWAKIQIDSPPPGHHYIELCELWLERARSLPLTITLHGSLRLEESLRDLLAVLDWIRTRGVAGSVSISTRAGIFSSSALVSVGWAIEGGGGAEVSAGAVQLRPTTAICTSG
ncbi:hypothetical protein R3P38DRAFT_1880141 [Favolaschia claudopus]|uniref:F-box domain-containing protein n=1 Tax=Favolaschia claudopus TaxID=2862362 RepID=A0AAW0DE73_9AGAR